jgi:hypothetical protein
MNNALHRVDARLLSILLTSCGATFSHVADLLNSGTVTAYLSGDIPTTVFRLGVVHFPFASDPHQSLLAEMRFSLKETAVQWLLLRYPTGECEVEVLVDGGTAPWHPTELPSRFELLFGKEIA